MAKSIATRPLRARTEITVDSLTVTVLASADVSTDLIDPSDISRHADMIDYYAHLED